MCLLLAAKSWLNDPEDKSQGERSFHVTHPLMLVIICAQYGKNLSRTVCAVERTQDVPHLAVFCKFMAEWPWRYRSMSKVIMCDTPSHGSDHLCLIGKESIQNCRSYRADTEYGTDGQIANSWLNDLEDIGQGQRSLYATHPLMLVIIWA